MWHFSIFLSEHQLCMYVWTQQFCSMLVLSETKLLYSFWKSIMRCWSVTSNVAMISCSLFDFCVKCQSCDAFVWILKFLWSSICRDSFSMMTYWIMSRLYISNSSNSSFIDFLILIANFDFLQPSQSSNYSLWVYECIAVTCQTSCISILCNNLNQFDLIWPDTSCHAVNDLVLDHSVQDLCWKQKTVLLSLWLEIFALIRWSNLRINSTLVNEYLFFAHFFSSFFICMLYLLDSSVKYIYMPFYSRVLVYQQIMSSG